MSLAMRDGIGGNDGAESTSATETGAGTGCYDDVLSLRSAARRFTKRLACS